MASIEERAHEAAQKDFMSYNGDVAFLAEKCVEFRNELTTIQVEFDQKEELTDDDFYRYYYTSAMEQQLNYILTDALLKSLNYEKNNKAMWVKKKKGLFR